MTTLHLKPFQVLPFICYNLSIVQQSSVKARYHIDVSESLESFLRHFYILVETRVLLFAKGF